MSSLPKIDPSSIGTRAQRIHALRVELESLSADVRNVAAKSRGVLDAVPSDLWSMRRRIFRLYGDLRSIEINFETKGNRTTEDLLARLNRAC